MYCNVWASLKNVWIPQGRTSLSLSLLSLYIYTYMKRDHWLVSLLVCLFVYSRTTKFSSIWRLSPLPVIGPTRRSGLLSREGTLSCHTYCDTGPRFKVSHPKDRHPRLTVGFEPRRKDHQIFAPDALTTAPRGRACYQICDSFLNVH
jgi:hypothetical protein